MKGDKKRARYIDARKKHGYKRETSIRCLIASSGGTHLRLGTGPATHACVLTRKPVGNLSLCRMTPYQATSVRANEKDFDKDTSDGRKQWPLLLICTDLSERNLIDPSPDLV